MLELPNITVSDTQPLLQLIMALAEELGAERAQSMGPGGAPPRPMSEWAREFDARASALRNGVYTAEDLIEQRMLAVGEALVALGGGGLLTSIYLELEAKYGDERTMIVAKCWEGMGNFTT